MHSRYVGNFCIYKPAAFADSSLASGDAEYIAFKSEDLNERFRLLASLAIKNRNKRLASSYLASGV